jgi:MFS family permease
MDQLKLLMDYTKFHLAMYASLVTGLTIWMELKPKTDQGIEFWALGFTMTCFLIAGAAGGIIASHIPDFSTYQEFREAYIGMWKARCKYNTWAHIEHYSFWLGIVVGVGGVMFRWR